MPRLLPLALLPLAACGATPAARPASLDALRESAIRAHMTFLADDLLEGRGTGTLGHELAARYVAAQLEALGLEPAAPGGGWFQRLTLRHATLVADRSRLTLIAGDKSEPFTLPEDGALPADLQRESTVASAPVVFVGYGVTAPHLKYDDFAGIDVRGKIVAYFTGGPPTFPPDERAVLGSAREIARNAAARGAVGVLSIRTDRDERILPWARASKSIAEGGMAWLEDDGRPHDGIPELRGSAILTPRGAEKLFARSPTPMAAALAAAIAGKAQPFELGVVVRIEKTSRHEALNSLNVLGRLPGSDRALAGETIILTAHLDHLGIGAPIGDDRIYNGAWDNASGNATLLEVARALAGAPRPPRSILFASVTGEEHGLLGSGYLAWHLPVPLEQVLCDLNLDMIPLHGHARDLIARGADHSSLGPAVAAAARRLGLTVGPDPVPEQSAFVRSDQYSFVRRGVPSVIIKPGLTARDPGMDLDAADKAWRAARYHAPSDDMSQPQDFSVAVEIGRVYAHLVWDLAWARTRPSWNAGDFFATPRP